MVSLEFVADTEAFTAVRQELRDRDVPPEEIRARAEELLGLTLPSPRPSGG